MCRQKPRAAWEQSWRCPERLSLGGRRAENGDPQAGLVRGSVLANTQTATGATRRATRDHCHTGRAGRLISIEVDRHRRGQTARLIELSILVLLNYRGSGGQVLVRDREPELGASTIRVTAGGRDDFRSHSGAFQHLLQLLDGLETGFDDDGL
ncbi:MAG: hypothetical protein ACI835_001624 [Planctomycetota bacterium]|jgi:hypothetical protein